MNTERTDGIFPDQKEVKDTSNLRSLLEEAEQSEAANEIPSSLTRPDDDDDDDDDIIAVGKPTHDPEHKTTSKKDSEVNTDLPHIMGLTVAEMVDTIRATAGALVSGNIDNVDRLEMTDKKKAKLAKIWEGYFEAKKITSDAGILVFALTQTGLDIGGGIIQGIKLKKLNKDIDSLRNSVRSEVIAEIKSQVQETAAAIDDSTPDAKVKKEKFMKLVEELKQVITCTDQERVRKIFKIDKNGYYLTTPDGANLKTSERKERPSRDIEVMIKRGDTSPKIKAAIKAGDQ